MWAKITTAHSQHNRLKKPLTHTIALIAPLLTSTVQAELYYFHNDHLGTPQVVTDTSGDVVCAGQYSAFGEVEETTALVQQDLRFPGQLLDRETGLHYNYFRDYDPGGGLYIESDPFGLRSPWHYYHAAKPVRPGIFGGVCGPSQSDIRFMVPDTFFADSCASHDECYSV